MKIKESMERCGVGICPRALERQSIIIVSICNVACCVRSNPVADYNLSYSVSCQCTLSVLCLRIIRTLIINSLLQAGLN